MTEHNHYEPSQEDFDVFEELCGDKNDIGVGFWSSADSLPQPIDLPLSDAELEERQRLRCIAELLEGRFDRPIRPELEALAQRLMTLSRSYQPTELPKVLPKLRDELVIASLARASSSTVTEPAPAAPPSYQPEMASWTLYQVWQHQLERDRADKTTRGGQANHGGTLEERERRARAMTVLTEHKPVCQLTKQDWQRAYDNACKVKASVKALINPPTPLNEFVTDDLDQMAGHERVTSLISAMKQIQRYANFLDLTATTPTDILPKRIERRHTARSRDGKPFSASDVEAIFSGYIYKGSIPSSRTKPYPYWFWLPLIGYFTGARTNEIAQLDTADIVTIEAHPCFDFCPDLPGAPEAKRIKTGEARQVPIHPRLLELGFLDYVSSQAEAKQKKLFGDGLTYLSPRNGGTAHNKEGWAKQAGKFFNESPNGYLVAVGVHVPNDGKSIYSFRHTLETNLRNLRREGHQVDQTVIDAITGHAPDTIADRHYDGGPTIQHKLTALRLLPIPNALAQLTGYNVDFVDRFGNSLTRSIASHRRRHPQPT